MKDLTSAVSFRNRCRKTDEYFKNAVQTEFDSSSDVVKQELSLSSEIIKDEPSDDVQVDLFENIDTILEENLERAEESTFVEFLSKKTFPDSSEDENEEIQDRKEKSKNSRKNFSQYDLIK